MARRKILGGLPSCSRTLSGSAIVRKAESVPLKRSSHDLGSTPAVYNPSGREYTIGKGRPESPRRRYEPPKGAPSCSNDPLSTSLSSLPPCSLERDRGS